MTACPNARVVTQSMWEVTGVCQRKRYEQQEEKKKFDE